MNDLTPAEVRDLRLIRARALMDRGDIEPMRWGSRAPEFTERAVPWREAMEIEVSTNE